MSAAGDNTLKQPTLSAVEPAQRLCAVLGHELRNPLAAAVTHVSIVAAQIDASDPRARALDDALGELSRVSSLLTAYLEFGRGAPVAPRAMDLVKIARSIASRQPRVQFNSDLKAAPVFGDPDLLGRAIDNLVENAQQAGAHCVWVDIQQREDRAVVVVRDDGPGVPPKLRDALFEPFISGNGTTGLGLAVARDVVQRQGGKLELLPHRPGRGATFELKMPIETCSYTAKAC